MKIKFYKAGKWADPDVNKPQIEVKAGEIVDVSLELAQTVIDADKGERVEEKPKKAAEDDEENGSKSKGGKPPAKDKDKAEQK